MVLEILALLPGAVGRAAHAVTQVATPRAIRRFSALLLGVGLVAGLAPATSAAVPSTRVVAAAPLPDPGFAPASPVAPRAPQPDADRPPSRSTPDPTPSTSTSESPGRRWLPTAPTVRDQPDVRVLSRPPRSADLERTEVVVTRGDSLWSIAARFLGPDVGDAQVADAWPSWYAMNRTVIGDDPDVLLPGQVLRVPEVARS